MYVGAIIRETDRFPSNLDHLPPGQAQLPKHIDYHECQGEKSKNAKNQFVWLPFDHVILLCETEITGTRLC